MPSYPGMNGIFVFSLYMKIRRASCLICGVFHFRFSHCASRFRITSGFVGFFGGDRRGRRLKHVPQIFDGFLRCGSNVSPVTALQISWAGEPSAPIFHNAPNVSAFHHQLCGWLTFPRLPLAVIAYIFCLAVGARITFCAWKVIGSTMSVLYSFI